MKLINVLILLLTITACQTERNKLYCDENDFIANYWWPSDDYNFMLVHVSKSLDEYRVDCFRIYELDEEYSFALKRSSELLDSSLVNNIDRFEIEGYPELLDRIESFSITDFKIVRNQVVITHEDDLYRDKLYAENMYFWDKDEKVFRFDGLGISFSLTRTELYFD